MPDADKAGVDVVSDPDEAPSSRSARFLRSLFTFWRAALNVSAKLEAEAVRMGGAGLWAMVENVVITGAEGDDGRCSLDGIASL